MQYQLVRKMFRKVIHFNCPACNAPLESPSGLAGLQDSCNACGEHFITPGPISFGGRRKIESLHMDMQKREFDLQIETKRKQSETDIENQKVALEHQRLTLEFERNQRQYQQDITAKYDFHKSAFDHRLAMENVKLDIIRALTAKEEFELVFALLGMPDLTMRFAEMESELAKTSIYKDMQAGQIAAARSSPSTVSDCYALAMQPALQDQKIAALEDTAAKTLVTVQEKDALIGKAFESMATAIGTKTKLEPAWAFCSKCQCRRPMKDDGTCKYCGTAQ